MEIKLSPEEASQICRDALRLDLGREDIKVEIVLAATPKSTSKISPSQLDQLWTDAVRPLNLTEELATAKLDLAKLYYALRLNLTDEPVSFMKARDFVVDHNQ